MASFEGTELADVFVGAGEADGARGYGGDDQLTGGGANDFLVGGAGADILQGDDGNDTLHSHDLWTALIPYPDPIDTSTEVDSLFGGNGDDRLYAGYGDHVDGGAVTSSGNWLHISFLGAGAGINFDLRLPEQTIGGGTLENITYVPYLQGSNFADNLNLGQHTTLSFTIDGTVRGMGGDDVIIGGALTGVISGGDGADIIDSRLHGNSSVSGDAGDDQLYSKAHAFGGDGNDVIFAGSNAYGGRGNDVIQLLSNPYSGEARGEDGNDELRASDDGQRMSGGAGGDLLIGGAGDDTLYSNDWGNSSETIHDTVGNFIVRDALRGAGGNDFLAVGYGDHADGGAGTDYLILHLGGSSQRVVANFNTLTSGGALTIGGGVIENIERLAYVAGTRFNDEFVFGHIEIAYRPTIDAGDGNDTITSSTGDGLFVNGGAGDDTLISGPANDRFDGGAGIDTVDYSRYGPGLPNVFDNLISVENFIGSAYNDTLHGNGSANQFRGGGGNDRFYGHEGVDTAFFSGRENQYLIEDLGIGGIRVTDLRDGSPDGIDTLLEVEVFQFAVGSGVVVDGTAGADKITPARTVLGQPKPGAQDDELNGFEGNDLLDGGAGADSMAGGLGNDTYTVDNAGDVVIEQAGQGIDTVKTTLTTYALTGHVEGLTAVGAADFDLTGNSLDNLVTGGAGADTLRGLAGKDNLRGGAGADRLVGGSEADILTGGADADRFVFDVLGASTSKDTVKDFIIGEDVVEIARSAFTAFAGDSAGGLDASAFVLGTKAVTVDQHLIYNATKGQLYYDADGAGGQAQVLVAMFSNKPSLSATDFVLA